MTEYNKIMTIEQANKFKTRIETLARLERQDFDYMQIGNMVFLYVGQDKYNITLLFSKYQLLERTTENKKEFCVKDWSDDLEEIKKNKKELDKKLDENDEYSYTIMTQAEILEFAKSL